MAEHFNAMTKHVGNDNALKIQAASELSHAIGLLECALKILEAQGMLVECAVLQDCVDMLKQ